MISKKRIKKKTTPNTNDDELRSLTSEMIAEMKDLKGEMAKMKDTIQSITKKDNSTLAVGHLSRVEDFCSITTTPAQFLRKTLRFGGF